MRLDGRDIKYTATAGTLPIRLDNGQVAARMFFVAYTKDGEDAKTRPVSFLYNGGPGAATIWLHMGSFSPKRVEMAADGFQPAPPYHRAEASHLETYTATAWYHKKLPADLAGDLKKAVDASREFAFGDYLTALAKGNRATPTERKAIASKLARLTGLSPDFVER